MAMADAGFHGVERVPGGLAYVDRWPEHQDPAERVAIMMHDLEVAAHEADRVREDQVAAMNTELAGRGLSAGDDLEDDLGPLVPGMRRVDRDDLVEGVSDDRDE